MDNSTRIAIIDNGINGLLIKRGIEKGIVVDANGICIDDTKNIDQQQFQHGTNCAMILEKHCSDCHLISIRILDENGMGAIKNIYPALQWCYENQISLVNLSLGTIDFREYEKLRCLINKYAAKGMIIVAATANSGFVSYPASLTNVIGVATTDSPLDYCKDYMQMGIDTVVPSVHTIRVHNMEISTSLSNSYAAPYISALIANKLNADGTFEIRSLKTYASEQSQLHIISGIYEPNWIYRAYVLGIGTASKAKYYFETVTGKYEEIQEEIDTIIAFSMTDLEKLQIGSKSLIYLGKDDIPKMNVQGFFWSRETRQQQIINNHYQGNGLDVPVVILTVESTIDRYYVLTELKKSFANDGYNAYTIGMEPECVLYGLEYMPEPASDQETWKKFIESQIFYKQSDLLVWCVSLEDRAKFLKVYPDCDVEICFCNEGENIVVKFSFEEEKAEKKFSELFDSKAIEEIYRFIETKLTEGEDG
jgi:hypothetical protein